MSYSYEIKDFDVGGRIGIMKIGGKVLETPNLFPVVSPFDNLISPKLMYDHFKVQAIFTNAYIIYKNLSRNAQIVEKGLHQHLEFSGIIATDSGGFQDYMYAGDIKVTPEEIEPFQEKLGSDCPVILDIPVQTTDSYEEAKRKVEITLERAKLNITRRQRNDTAWFGPIHGSIFPDLLKYSTIEMSKLDYGIYAIGGVVKTFIDYRFDLDIDILLQVRRYLNPSRPLHIFGLGLPNFFALAVACGADTFDSAAYILYAKDGRYFTQTGTKHISELNEFPCVCPICTKYTPKEILQLPKEEQTRLLASHNLYISFAEIRTIKQAIREGSLWDLVEQRIRAHPKLVEAFKVIKNYPDYFDSLINMNKTKGIKLLSNDTFYRPELIRARNKVQCFQIPPGKNCVICLPELDLPGKNGLSYEHWFNHIEKSPNLSKFQILIVNSMIGITPYELSEMYPFGQHEGTLDLNNLTQEKSEFLLVADAILRRHKDQIKSICFLIPDEFINEYSEITKFQPVKHVISILYAYIKEKFPQISLQKYSRIEDLILNAGG